MKSYKFRYLLDQQFLMKCLVIAIAKEGEVAKPNTNQFLQKHKLPTPSSVNQALKTLLDKEILFKTHDGYKVYDVFLKRFIKRYFSKSIFQRID